MTMDLKLDGEAMQALVAKTLVDSSTAYELDDGKLLIVGKRATMAAAIERVPVGEDEHAVIIDRALLANISLPVGDYGELMEDAAKSECDETLSEYSQMFAALMVQGQSPEAAAAFTIARATHDSAQQVFALQGEVERLREALNPFADIVQDDEMDGSFDRAQVEVRLEVLRRARAVLSQHQGEGEKP